MALAARTVAWLVVVACCLDIWLSPISGDGAIFLGVGRALLNGLQLYRDAFETKPPGIFLLSAASHLLGGHDAARIFSILAVLTVVGTSVFCDRANGILIGAILAFYVTTRAGDYYPEAFGTAALCIYVAVLCHPGPESWRKTLASTLAIAIALLFKEPFLLSALAIGVYMLRSGKAFIRQYLVPQVLALIVFGLVLLLTGSFADYLDVYLPFMFSVRVGQSAAAIWFTANDFIVALVWLPFVLLAGSQEENWRGRARLAAALCLAIAAASIGEYSGKHSVAAVPIILPIFICAAAREYFASLALAALIYLPIWTGWPLHDRSVAVTIEADRVTARKLDEVLTACDIDRYFYIGGNTHLHGFTEHSQAGQLLFLNMYMLQHPYLVDESLKRLRESSLILFERKQDAMPIEKQYYDETQEYVAENFTLTPWECAGGTISTERYVLFFRKT
jgi:hypothetical protein